MSLVLIYISDVIGTNYSRGHALQILRDYNMPNTKALPTRTPKNIKKSFTFRIDDNQRAFIYSQGNPSAYLRSLISEYMESGAAYETS